MMLYADSWTKDMQKQALLSSFILSEMINQLLPDEF